jgi:hypothetical protein
LKCDPGPHWISSRQVQAGWVVIGDLERGAFREIDVTVSVPEGWLPDDPGNILNELLACPTFIDNRTAAVELPTGELRKYSILAAVDS